MLPPTDRLLYSAFAHRPDLFARHAQVVVDVDGHLAPCAARRLGGCLRRTADLFVAVGGLPDRLAVALGGLRCLRVARFGLPSDGGGGGGQFVRPRLGLCDGLVVLGGGDDAVFKRFLGLCGRTLQIGGGSGVFDACGQPVVGGFGFPRAVFRRIVQTLHLFAR